jgi:hypothetical protein
MFSLDMFLGLSGEGRKILAMGVKAWDGQGYVIP